MEQIAGVDAQLGSANQKRAVEGSLLGLMVGDALGLPFEGISARRIKQLLKARPRHALVFGKGMISDDTEHAAMTAASMVTRWGDWDRFQGSLAWRLRWWLMRLPAGIGMATGRAIIKLWMGFPAKYSGVYSAGNGPAMRAPIIGVCLGHDRETMKQVVAASTVITHKDPKATVAALAVAQAAYMAGCCESVSLEAFRSELQSLLATEDSCAVKEFENTMDRLESHWEGNPEAVAEVMGLKKGVTGYSYHTVPMVLFLWLKYQSDYAAAVEAMIRLGGDTDTTSAILGGILGAGVGKEGIPQDWIEDIVDWPITAKYLQSLSEDLAFCMETGERRSTRWLPGPPIFVRNLMFLAIVLVHGFRRLLPPY